MGKFAAHLDSDRALTDAKPGELLRLVSSACWLYRSVDDASAAECLTEDDLVIVVSAHDPWMLYVLAPGPTLGFVYRDVVERL